MTDRYGGGSWQNRKETLMQAYFDLEKNPLWQDIMEDCQLRAGDLDASAAVAVTDREANRLHGMASGIRTMVSRAVEIREARMLYYQNEQAKDELERGREGVEFEGDGNEPDHHASAGPGKIQRRSLFTEEPEHYDDAGAGS